MQNPVKIGFKNYGDADRQCWKLTFNGVVSGDQKSFKSPQQARMEAQKYFDRQLGDIMARYTVDASSYYEALDSLK